MIDVKSSTFDGVLFYYSYIEKNASTITEHIDSFNKYSKYRILKWNILWGKIPIFEKLNSKFIIFHYSIPPEDYHKQYWINESIKSSKDIFKLIFFQDEYHYCNERFAFINKFNINTIYSCVPKESLKNIYGRNTTAKALHESLTG